MPLVVISDGGLEIWVALPRLLLFFLHFLKKPAPALGQTITKCTPAILVGQTLLAPECVKLMQVYP